ncbi:U3 small nucleolar RNA-associated protein 25, partial [Tremellales sp. Uapishka_1]
MSTAVELKLLTLLNVSAVKRPRERDIPGGHRGSPSVSLSNSDEGKVVKKRKGVIFGGEIGPSGSFFEKKRGKGKGKGRGEETSKIVAVTKETMRQPSLSEIEQLVEDDDDEEGNATASTSARADLFNVHFGVDPPVLTAENVDSEWKAERKTLKGYGRCVELTPKAASGEEEEIKTRITPSILTALQDATSLPPLLSTALHHLGSYKDFYLHSLDGEADGSETKAFGEEKESLRKAAMVHSLNHVLKTRKKIIRNNEKLAHAAASTSASSETPLEQRDQSFTRPKVLLLLPVRSLALHYLTTHLFPLAPKGTQIENYRPFTSSFAIPADIEDPLEAPTAAASFAIDHLVNFRGNSDDNFRFGIKFTRKAWRVVMMPANEDKLLDCDILIASPLGIKMQAEREDSTDLLSSIEICLVDGIDVMQMQNWDHVSYVFSHLNKIPKSPHGCDFSRVKPWYLDSQAKYLRQTILLSRYDTPEARSLLHRSCHNLQGKIRLEIPNYGGALARVKPGVKQVFERFDLEGTRSMQGEAAVEEIEKRLEWFVKKTVPALLKSAVSRENTLIIIPSYFDFVKVQNYLRKADIVSFAAISEYSSNAEIGRARTLFFKGKKQFLLVTERFHFYRRYRIRGAKTLVFFALPEHAQFYSEFLQTPFLPSQKAAETEAEVEVDEGEITSRVLFSRFDVLKLERVVGTVNARRMIGSGEGRFEFI